LDESISSLEGALHSHYRLGFITFVVLLSIVVFWAYIVPLAGAVVVGGTFVIHSSDKKIQHKGGGVVAAIAVEDGQKVKAGDVLIRLDPNEARAQNAATARQIDEVQLRLARLAAERDNGQTLIIPDKIFMPPAEYAKLAKAEHEFFKARQASQEGIHKLADARLAQLDQEMTGFQAQLEANQKQRAITAKELAGAQELFDKKISTIQRVTPLQREVARLEGVIAQLESSIKSDRSRSGEIKLQVQQSEESFRADVMKDYSDASAKLGQLLEAYLVTNQTLKHTDIVAPVAGVVHDIAVHTVGGVINPGETIMTIIPVDEELEVDVKLASDRIDQVRVGQSARVKLTAFERTTPDIHGVVKFISADLVESKVGSYYDVRLSVDQHPHGLNLTPGMPAEVFIKTDDRTMMSYLLKPLRENMGRAFRER
jgi:HlyD family secretion protein